MDWMRDKHIRLCQNCLAVFAGLLIALDIAALWLCRWFCGFRSMPGADVWLMTATLYLCSVPAWLVLIKMAKLLVNLRMAEVFVEENVTYLLSISRYCLIAAVICLVSTAYYIPFIFVAIAGFFMSMVVRIVAEVFRQAIGMKDELDLTV